MKKFIGTTIPLVFFHLFCCGAFLIFLATSGYLLLIREEGSNKKFLIPILVFGVLSFYLYTQHSKKCDVKKHRTFKDHLLLTFLYISFSLLFGLAFMIYVFIPWWIPGYKGGLLLP